MSDRKQETRHSYLWTNLTLFAARAVLIPLFTLSGCAALQQVSQSAANNAKPASPPLLTERPPSSALWPGAPTTFYIGARTFTFNISYNLFNKVSVKLGNRQAVELPRGSFSDYRPIDRSQLASHKVYFRLMSQSSDVNRQTQIDLLEIADMDNVFTDLPLLASGNDLIVGETSINPAYAGTSNAYQESTWGVVLNRDAIGPPGSGRKSNCTFDLESTDILIGADRGFRAPPGKKVLFNVPSQNCKSVGFLINGQPNSMVEYPDIRSRMDNHGFTVPTDAAVESDIKFQVLGLDVLKRPSFYDVHVIVKAASSPPSLPCASNNGFGGKSGLFVFCAICGTDRIPFRGNYCSASEAQTAANNALSFNGYTNCSLSTAECSTCPVDASNPAGQLQAFSFCVACPAGQFAWNISDGAQAACTRDDATQYVENSNISCSVTPSLAQIFDICIQCPGLALKRSPVRACTDSQAVDMAKAAVSSSCNVVKCPLRTKGPRVLKCWAPRCLHSLQGKIFANGKKPAHLSTSGGYVFYLWGCQTAGTPPPGRQFSSRAFTIALNNTSSRRRAVRH